MGSRREASLRLLMRPSRLCLLSSGWVLYVEKDTLKPRLGSNGDPSRPGLSLKGLVKSKDPRENCLAAAEAYVHYAGAMRMLDGA